MNQDEQVTHPNIYEHPHSVIVRERLVDFLTRLETAHPECMFGVPESVNSPLSKSPREHMHLSVKVGTQRVRPIEIKLERRGHLPANKRNIGGLYNAYTASITSLPFFRKHNYDRYYWEDDASDFWVNDISSELFDCLRSLEEYCIFKTCVNMPEIDEVITCKGRVRIFICLREEYFATRDHDFVASIRIACPNETHRNLRAFFERREYQQAQKVQTV